MKDDQTTPQCEEISVDPYRCSLPAGHTGEHLTRLEDLPVSYAPPVPSARTVTRQHPADWLIAQLRGVLRQHWDGLEDHPSNGPQREALEALVTRSAEVAPLLTALEEQDQEIARLKEERDTFKAAADSMVNSNYAVGELTARAEAAEATLAQLREALEPQIRGLKAENNILRRERDDYRLRVENQKQTIVALRAVPPPETQP